MLWIVLALQAMTPFIHAHADAMHLGHAQGPHLHHALSADAASHAFIADAHDVTVAVPNGLPPGDAAAAIEAPAGAHATRPAAPAASDRAAGAFPLAPPLDPSPPDHVFPPTQAPPFG